MSGPDIVVIGSGIGGLFFALQASKYATVAVVTKKDRPESSTNYAQGGVAAVFAPDDSPRLHAEDTFVAGAGLCDPAAVEVLVSEGPGRVRELMEIGVRFSSEDGALSLGREGGHSRRRIVRADDLTGREIERALLDAVAASARVTVYENHLAVDLILDRSAGGEGRCAGVVVLEPEGGRCRRILSRAVVVAAGGCGQVYRHTTNPAIATGDGIAMAYRAGARIANMEFVQFHPTALHPADQRTFLISEAVRGEGALLCRLDGTPFVEGYHPLGSLAPRDIVARAIDREMKQSGDPYVLLDCSTISEAELRRRFPNILRETAERGYDMLRDPIPVVPAAHYLCGGILTDTFGSSSLPGLYAVGEAACTGVHGANRLASNSLLEALVFAGRAADLLEQRIAAMPAPSGGVGEGEGEGVEDSADRPHPEAVLLVHDREEIRSLMWDLVGIVRSDERLEIAEARVRQMAEQYEAIWSHSAPDADLAELRNLVQVAEMIVTCARRRRESRGLHYNLDHPYRDNERFLADTVIRRPKSRP